MKKDSSDLKQKLARAQKRIEELEAKQSEMRWHMLFEYAPDACYLCTLTGTFIDGNRKAEQLTGYERDELIGKNFLELNLLRTKDIVRAGTLLAQNALGKATGPDEFQVRKKDNQWITLEISTFPVQIDQRSVILGIARDITDRKKDEEELRQYRDRLEEMVQQRTADLEATNKKLQNEIEERQKAVEALKESETTKAALLRTIPDLIFRVDRSGRFLDVLPAKDFEPILPPDQFLGKKLDDVLPAQLAQQGLEYIQKALDTGEMTAFEYALTIKNEERFFEARQVAYNKDQVLCMVRDITEKKHMENNLVRLERMQAMWELSEGVSHNFNNILTGILIPSQILQRTATDEQTLKNLQRISESGHTAADLVKRLDEAIRSQEGKSLEKISMNNVVQDVVQATQPHWQDEPQTRDISIILDTDLQDECTIWGTKSGLSSCLVNLIFNAIDAMPKGGTISITASKTEHEITLQIQDTGIGMTEEVRRRVFEPFFTTKANVGTGLGLFTVYGTITGWGGQIQVDSEPGQGTTFTLTFPRTNPQPKSNLFTDA